MTGERMAVRASQIRLGDVFVWNSGTSLPVVRAEVVCIEPEFGTVRVRVTTERLDDSHRRGVIDYRSDEVLIVEREART